MVFQLLDAVSFMIMMLHGTANALTNWEETAVVTRKLES
jgi:hypothetical protein